MKPRIFIGSSSEELHYATKVKRLLEPEFDVVIWNDNLWEKSTFKLNNNFLNDLLKAPLKFDYGILIGTPDDQVTKRDKDVLQARDNILFEFGLFIGRMGIKKCCFLVKNEVDIMSDLSGIFLSKFTDINLFEKVDEIKNHFLLDKSDSINFFPSNTLATGYFENFVNQICKHYLDKGSIQIEEKTFTDISFKILIPNHISENITTQFQQIKRKLDVKQFDIDCFGRMRPFNVNAKLLGENKIEIIDFPTTISGINFAIKELLPEEYKANNQEYQHILKRELNRFSFTLQSLINRNHLSDLIEIVREDN